jgi:hypothetical protein
MPESFWIVAGSRDRGGPPAVNRTLGDARLIPLTASVSRRAGGLYDAIRHLAHALHTPSLNIQIFGLADPDTESDLAGWGGLPVQTVKVRGPRFFGYAPALSPALQTANLDLLHTHGLLDVPFSSGFALGEIARKALPDHPARHVGPMGRPSRGSMPNHLGLMPGDSGHYASAQAGGVVAHPCAPSRGLFQASLTTAHRSGTGYSLPRS